ncbi:M24 family metallopeptidase [Marihabitans asiaticum]|uniref:Ectoine hydrolase n=1 Tax=Marihabitans asiaticum TaxID=415218 RepID=A0A560W888_9MICO|nr:M24 family metallopeptidase [Marihabitans asiaticum]TWD13799.1 ectoine hydrolase [Marihabitans asiaticum]
MQTRRPFAPDEYERRLEAVQREMSSRSMAALVVVDPASINYLCGYDAWSFYMPQCLVVPSAGLPHFFTRAMDVSGGAITADLPDDRVHGYPETLVHRPDVHPFTWMTERAVELGLMPRSGDAEVGVDLDAHFFSARGHACLAEGLAPTRVVDSHQLVSWVRVVKSFAEQDLMRAAGRIASRAMSSALETAAPGVRQCDVVAAIQRAQAEGAGDAGGDYPAIVPMLPTGKTAGTPHLTWSDRPLQFGEATTIELAGVHRRYHAPLARTISLGKPPRRLMHTAGAVDEGLHAALEAMVPGNAVRDVHEAFSSTIAHHGLYKESRIGYSIGIGYPPDWGERTISLRSEETAVLQAGMAFHMILGMWEDDWGYETSESLLVQPLGPERLTDVPQGLYIRD